MEIIKYLWNDMPDPYQNLKTARKIVFGVKFIPVNTWIKILKVNEIGTQKKMNLYNKKKGKKAIGK